MTLARARIRPGQLLKADRQRLTFRAYSLGVVILGIAIIFVGLGSIPLLSLNEARRAVPVEVMHATGDWLLPRLNGELYVAKPPLFYWCAAAISAIAGGVSEWTLRLPSALAATSILALVFYSARKYFNRDAAIAVLAVLLSCSAFALFARRAEIEMIFAAWNTAALLTAHEFMVSGQRRYAYASYAALGLAVLTKGPVALLFVLVPVLLCGRRERARAYLGCAGGWFLLLAIGLSWYVWVSSRLGFGVWRDIVLTDMAGKISGTHGRDSVFTYVQAVLLDFLPWSLVLVITPRRTWREWMQDPTARFLLVAVAAPLLIFTLISEKHAKYLLPAYPAIALLIGVRVAQIMQESRERFRRVAVVLSLILLTGYAVFYVAFERRVYAYRFSGMAAIQAIARQFPEVPLNSLSKVDMRAVYYYGRSIPILSRADVAAVAASPQPQLVLVESDRWAQKTDMTGWRELQRITPYISRGQTALVMANSAFLQKYPEARPH